MTPLATVCFSYKVPDPCQPGLPITTFKERYDASETITITCTDTQVSLYSPELDKTINVPFGNILWCIHASRAQSKILDLAPEVTSTMSAPVTTTRKKGGK